MVSLVHLEFLTSFSKDKLHRMFFNLWNAAFVWAIILLTWWEQHVAKDCFMKKNKNLLLIMSQNLLLKIRVWIYSLPVYVLRAQEMLMNLRIIHCWVSTPALKVCLFVTCSTEWENLFNRPDMMKKLKERALEGNLRSSRFRSVIWKVCCICDIVSPDMFRQYK